MGYSSDHLPHVGNVPQRKNQFIIAGFTGHGMPQIFLTAKGLATIVVDGVDFKDSGIPRIYQTSKERLSSQRSKPLEIWHEMFPNKQSKL